jgi:hypothetical protein
MGLEEPHLGRFSLLVQGRQHANTTNIDEFREGRYSFVLLGYLFTPI